MLIRRPADVVFEAFVDPAITSQFWFSAGSERLDAGKRVRWDWEMYGVGTDVDVIALEPNRRILVEWDVPADPTSVEWIFEPQADRHTLVSIRNWGFSGTPDETLAKALDAQGGFSFVLAGLKAYLEHGIALNLVADHAPAALVESWRRRLNVRADKAGEDTPAAQDE